MTGPKNALLKQYAQALHAACGARLVVTPAAVAAVAREAEAKGTGARGLRAVLERCLAAAMYEAPSVRGG